MQRMASSLTAKIQPIVAHVKTCLERHQTRAATRPGTNSKTAPPLFVAFQGPQGSGKTFLTSQLSTVLSAPPHNLAVAVLSIDDLYLPHDSLVRIAQAHSNNVLLSGRGQPGTHDVPLGTKLLEELKTINNSSEGSVSGNDAKGVRFPAFEKSLYDGQGDCVPDGGVLVRPPVDIVLFEGWCVGFCPVDKTGITRRFSQRIPDLEGILDLQSSFKEEDVLQINQNLWDYAKWWEFFDAFVQVKPPDATPYSLIYKWRLQQEHNMKAKNGGKGMIDEQVKTFIDRYIPGYVFFSDGIEHGYVDASGTRYLPRWLGSGLKVVIDEKRELISVDKF